MIISDCCGSNASHYEDDESGLCPKCKEHCGWIDDSKPDPDFEAYWKAVDKDIEYIREQNRHLRT